MSHTHIPLMALTGLVQSLNSDVKAFKTVIIQCNSFCQQVDDWMLLKITEELSEEMFLKKERESRVYKH